MKPRDWRFGKAQEEKLMPWFQALELVVQLLVQGTSSRRKTPRLRLECMYLRREKGWRSGIEFLFLFCLFFDLIVLAGFLLFIFRYMV